MMSHNWGTAQQHIPIAEDDGEPVFSSAPILSVDEAERYVESLREFSIEEVGSDAWMDQHELLEKLNLQAHHCTMSNSDEFVLEAILTFDKLKVLIHDLIITEAWVDLVFPNMIDTLAEKNSMRTYFILYHQASLINLFEVLLYHKHVCEAGGEMLIELVDYCARKLMRLNGGYDFSSYDPVQDQQTISSLGSAENSNDNAKKFLEKMEKRTPVEDLMQHLSQIEFRVCITAVAIARFLCEHSDSLVLSVSTRITDTHDYLVLMIPLIENPPWTRRIPAAAGKPAKWQKLIDFKWTDVLPIDLLKLTKLEGQPWLALFALLSKKVFRERYHINSFRKDQLLRVRKFLNDILLDQLPVLADIQRYMDELAMSDGSQDPAANATSSLFKFQQVAVYREKLLKNKNWKTIALEQLRLTFTMTDRTDRFLTKMANLYCDDAVEGLLEPSRAMPGAADGDEEAQKPVREFPNFNAHREVESSSEEEEEAVSASVPEPVSIVAPTSVTPALETAPSTRIAIVEDSEEGDEGDFADDAFLEEEPTAGDSSSVCDAEDLEALD